MSTADQREATRLSARLRAASGIHHDDVRRSVFVTALHARRLPWKAYADWLTQLFFVHESLVQVESAMVGDAVEPVLVRSATASLPALAADLRFLYGPTWSQQIVARAATTVYCTHLRDVAFRRFSAFVAHHWTRHIEDLAIGPYLAPAMALAYGLDDAGLRFLRPVDTDLALFQQHYGQFVDEGPADTTLVSEMTRAQWLYHDVIAELGRWWT
jgi:heme oxygenase (biliverdin-producing, ferredoxin)